MAKKITITYIKKEVHKVTGCKDDDEGFKAGVVMIAGLQVGPNADKIAAFTGYPREKVREFGRRLRANGIWKNRQTQAGWFGKDGGIEFNCDVNVALGFMNRVPSSNAAPHSSTVTKERP